MPSLSQVASIRFGYGLGEGVQTRHRDELLAQLFDPDPMADRVAQHQLNDAIDEITRLRKLRRSVAQGKVDSQKLQDEQKKTRIKSGMAIQAFMARAIYSPHGFRERLTMFWQDHFTIAVNSQPLGVALPSMIDEAIRPNVSGRFSELLKAAVLHPAMLEYLDQSRSIGPNSKLGKRRGKGLNENLARELLELHTLGVDGSYTQEDVLQLAELLTGLHISQNGTRFLERAAEPGSETILGKRYGGPHGSMKAIYVFLEDVSLHPNTARHLAQKLVQHFIAMDGQDALIDRMAGNYLAKDGELSALYEVMLADDASWGPFGAKVKSPYEFVASGIKALGLEFDDFMALSYRDIRREIAGPMSLMGQTMFRPQGPDGWPEEAEAWITPAGLAGRLQWGMMVARHMEGQLDPRDLLARALGDLASPALNFAVNKSENKLEAMALIFASPEFNRR